MGFLHPVALLALPLALLPLWLEWRGLRSGTPVRFSSLYLLERARRAPVPRLPTRSRWVALLRALAVAGVVLASARPLGCGAGDPASHRPTRAIVAVDVSASAGQLADGVTSWEGIRAAADSLLALAGPEDGLALAAVADGIVGWWEAPAPALRARLAELGPGDRASDWPRVLAALEARLDEDTESYLLTDGSRGAVPPAAAKGPRTGRRVVGIRGATPAGNRGLARAAWVAEGEVSLAGLAWGEAPAAAEVGPAGGGAEARPIPLDGSLGTASWPVADTATFAFREPDALPADDRLFVARGGGDISYDIVRYVPGDEPPESGPLFWEAALEALPDASRVSRSASLAGLVASAPDLVLLPIRAYRGDEVELLLAAVEGGTRLLFSPACATAGCAPPPGWFPAATPAVPDLGLEEPAGSAPLTGRPGSSRGTPVPEPLLDRAPIKGGLVPRNGPAPEWTWDLATGRPALWARGPIAIWLIPLGPPHTRLATTPVFPLVARAALSAWDPRWSADAAGTRVGAPLRALPDGATVTGPLHAGSEASRWEVPPGGASPRPGRAGLYRVRDPAGSTIFLAVNGDPAEGDLARISADEWEAAWGPVVPPEEWRGALFPRRRGPEMWPWALVLATLALAAEAAVRRVRLNK
ncbi:MAG TPA: BatA domain-containing protein [Gemmatimonadota bacterium]|jgi:hypothetical protein